MQRDMPARAEGLAIVLLAGGKATRFPGKLEHRIDELPLLVRTYRGLGGTYPVYIAANAAFSPEVDAALDAPVIVDRWPRSGPLGALVSACGTIAHERIFAIAGDTPNAGATVLDALLSAGCDDDEAVVPEHEGRLEPLAALYDRNALQREGFALLRTGVAAMHALLERLRVRRVTLPTHLFVNVNTPADLRGLTT